MARAYFNKLSDEAQAGIKRLKELRDKAQAEILKSGRFTRTGIPRKMQGQLLEQEKNE